MILSRGGVPAPVGVGWCLLRGGGGCLPAPGDGGGSLLWGGLQVHTQRGI